MNRFDEALLEFLFARILWQQQDVEARVRRRQPTTCTVYDELHEIIVKYNLL